MTRRKQGGWEIVASLPWQAGIALGLIGYIAIRHGIGWYLGSTGNPYLSGLGRIAAAGTYAVLAWALLIGCWIAAIASFIGRAHRRKLLDSQTGIDSLRQMSWRQFEQLTGEAFRRQGYAIEETGLGGADGGIDLILHKNGQTTLVQCKQWQARQVGVKTVREMYGLLLHHNAAAVKIVALGDYTRDAQRFAQGKPIELVPGNALIATVRSLQTSGAHTIPSMNSLPALGGSMVASLLVIAALSPATANAPPPAIPPPVAVQPTVPRVQASPHRSTTPPSQPQAVIYATDTQNNAQLREWKQRHAESLKIMEKSTKEMPLH